MPDIIPNIKPCCSCNLKNSTCMGKRPNSPQIITASTNGSLHMYEENEPCKVVDNVMPKSENGEQTFIQTLAFTPRGAIFLSGCSNGVIRMHKTINLSVDKTLAKSQTAISSLDISKNGLYSAFASMGQEVTIIPLAEPDKIFSAKEHDGSVLEVRFSPNSEANQKEILVSIGSDRSLKVWSFTPSGENRLDCVASLDRMFPSHLVADIDSFIMAAWNKRGSYVAIPGLNELRLIKKCSWEVEIKIKEMTGEINFVIWNEESNLVATGGRKDRKFSLWSLCHQKILFSETFPSEIVGICWLKANKSAVLTLQGDLSILEFDIKSEVSEAMKTGEWEILKKNENLLDENVIENENEEVEEEVDFVDDLMNSKNEGGEVEDNLLSSARRKSLRKRMKDNSFLDELGIDRTQKVSNKNFITEVSESSEEEKESEENLYFAKQRRKAKRKQVRFNENGEDFSTKIKKRDFIKIKDKNQMENTEKDVNFHQRDGVLISQSPLPGRFNPQPTFTPGSTEVKNGRRYLSSNLVGMVTMIREGTTSIVDIEFSDISRYKQDKIIGSSVFVSANLCENGIFLGVQRNPPLKLQNGKLSNEFQSNAELIFKSFGKSEESWSLKLEKDDDITLVAGNEEYLIAATASNQLRIFSLSGLQIVFITFPGRIVTMTARDDVLAVVYDASGCYGDALPLMCQLFDLKEKQRIVEVPLPINRRTENKVSLKWIGLNEYKMLVAIDTKLNVKILSAASNYAWTQLKNLSKELEVEADFLPMGCYVDKIVGFIIAKNSSLPISPKPMASTLNLKLPLFAISEEKYKEDAEYRSLLETEENVTRNEFFYREARHLLKKGIEIRMAERVTKEFRVKIDRGLFTLFYKSLEGHPLKAISFAERFCTSKTLRMAIECGRKSGLGKVAEELEKIKLKKFPEKTRC